MIRFRYELVIKADTEVWSMINHGSELIRTRNSMPDDFCRNSKVGPDDCLAAGMRHVRAAAVAGHSLAAIHVRLRRHLAGHKACELRNKPPAQQDADYQRSERPRHVESIHQRIQEGRPG